MTTSRRARRSSFTTRASPSRETPEDVHKLLISYRTGDLWSPNLPGDRGAAVEAEHFAACIRRRGAADHGRRGRA